MREEWVMRSIQSTSSSRITDLNKKYTINNFFIQVGKGGGRRGNLGSPAYSTNIELAK